MADCFDGKYFCGFIPCMFDGVQIQQLINSPSRLGLTVLASCFTHNIMVNSELSIHTSCMSLECGEVVDTVG